MKILIFTQKYLKKYSGYMCIYILLVIAAWCIGILVPFFTGRYIDLLIDIKDKGDIFFYTKIILALGTGSCLVSYYRGITLEKVKRRTTNSLNLFLLDHIKKLPISFFRENNSVYVIDRINTDANQLVSFTVEESLNLFINICTGLVVIIVMGTLNLRLTMVLISIIPIYLLIYLVFKKKMYEVRHNFIENQNRFQSALNQQINRGMYIKLNSLYDYMQEKIMKRFEDFFLIIMRFMKVASLYGNINSMIESIASVTLFLYGGIEVYRGNLTVGEFTIINIYFNMLFNAIQYLSRFGSTYQRTLVSFDRVMDILNIEKEKNGSLILKEIDSIELKDVSFSYDDKNPVLNGFSYTFIKDRLYCIKGFNGSGKSTLIKVMLGIEQGYEGEIRFKGTELKEIDMYNLRKAQVGITEQEPILLNDTLRNNISHVYSKDREKEILNYAEKLNLIEFIESLPNGLDTIIDENNTNISGGEKQKISLIRVLLKDPEIIILDEPSSALDKESIELFKDILMGIKEKKIIILISHDDNIIDFSDEIVEII